MHPNDLIKHPQVDTSTPWSIYQREIFDAILSTKHNIIIEAVAGSGKTTTMVEAINRLCEAQSSKSILALAFNKSIATELQRRLPSTVSAMTFHALGLSTFKVKPKVSLSKCRWLLKDAAPSAIYEDHARDILRLVSMAKTSVEEVSFYDLLSDFDISCPAGLESKFVSLAEQVLSYSDMNNKEIDFDDMLRLPFIYNHTFPQFDYVFVDEAQDLSDIQHHMILNLLSLEGRVIAVGDTHQAIYGFRGADHNSMNRFRQQFDTLELPLSISYRCPSSVVTAAQHYVPHIKAAPNAIEGKVTHEQTLPELTSLTSKDLILCRNNAPLFRLALHFLKLQHPAYVRGSFGDSLISFINNFKTQDIEVFKVRLKMWYNKEYERLISAEQTSKAGFITDKYEAVTSILTVSETVDELKENVLRLTTPNNGVTLSTIHRAKGTEATNVYFYLPHLLPSKYCTNEAALQQEHNLTYVGITRSLSTLTYITEEQ